MTELALRRPRGAAGVSAPYARAFYIAEAFLMSAIVLAGFWPYYAALPGGGQPRHWILHLHGAVFTGWLVILVSQAALVYKRDLAAHRSFGRFAAFYAVIILLLGAAVSLVAPVEHVKAGRWPLDQAAGFLVLPIGDLILFGGFFGAAIAYRRTGALHKRLILLASNALVFPGAARFGEPSVPMIFGLWFLPVVLAMAFDQFTAGRIHRVYWIGVGVMLVFFARVALMTAEPWLVIGRAILQPFL
jgi:hypothetical protein